MNECERGAAFPSTRPQPRPPQTLRAEATWVRKAQQGRVEQLLDEDRNAHGNSGRSARIRAGDSSKARSGAGYSSGGARDEFVSA